MKGDIMIKQILLAVVLFAALVGVAWSEPFYTPVVRDIELHGGLIDIGYARVIVSTWGQDGLYKVTVRVFDEQGKKVRKSTSRWFRWNGEREMKVDMWVGGLWNMGYFVTAKLEYAPYVVCER